MKRLTFFLYILSLLVVVHCACRLDGSIRRREGEDCDDGNRVAGDGCNLGCRIEPGWTCAVVNGKSVCAAMCGDGQIVGPETCDDQNQANGDGCSSSCKIEIGWLCQYSQGKSVCQTICGDKLIIANENCDDGNTVSLDGCSSSCRIEKGFECAYTTVSTCKEVCGNSIISVHEACDDGNLVDGDGCSKTCIVESGYNCNGEPSICNLGCGDGTISANEGCDDGNLNNEDGCSSSCVQEKGWLCISTPSSCSQVCSDGVITRNEQCDDRNLNDNDGCGKTCLIEAGYVCNGQPSVCQRCGNGRKEGGEGCDDGNILSGDGCSSGCSTEAGYTCLGAPSICSTCGDGVKDGNEQCDDGNNIDTDGCSGICQVEAGWNCTTVTPTKCVQMCGDGIRTKDETCDDGANFEGDGCTHNCIVEVGWACSGSPSQCRQICGNFFVTLDEICDDGNSLDQDGCSKNCTIEAGFTCTGQPSACLANCGDGFKTVVETCDDNNTLDGDGCSSNCQIETGWTCTINEVSVCLEKCGDGVITRSEQCDDGNLGTSDGCGNCLVEEDWKCSGQPSKCSQKSDNQTTIIVVPVAVGTGLGAILLATILVMRRNKRKKKLSQPDFKSLAFGNDLNEAIKESLNPDSKITLKYLHKLMVGSENSILLPAFFSTIASTEVDKLSKALVYIFLVDKKVNELLQIRILQELNEATCEGSLFRANSLATKMFTTYCKFVAMEYLWKTLSLVAHEINDLGEGPESKYTVEGGQKSLMEDLSLEVDPTKMDEEADMYANKLQLQLVAQRVFTTIIKSVKDVPEPLREILSFVGEKVEAKYSAETKCKAIGGFYFLRFVCPSIVTPHVYGLLEQPPNESAQRYNVLLSKILQNISNGTLPGKKEGYMEALNDFIQHHIEPAKNFCVEIGKSSGSSTTIDIDIPENVFYNALISIQNHMTIQSDKLLSALDATGGSEELKDQVRSCLKKEDV